MGTYFSNRAGAAAFGLFLALQVFSAGAAVEVKTKEQLNTPIARDSTELGRSVSGFSAACGGANASSVSADPTGLSACRVGSKSSTDSIANDGTYNWNCASGSSVVSCSANAGAGGAQGQAGTCGSAKNSTASSVPTGTAACGSGTQSTTDSIGSDGTYNWTCGDGSLAVSCTATAQPAAKCGASNATTVSTLPSGVSACGVGSQTTSDAVGSDGAFNWTCSSGSSNVSCSAQKTSTPPSACAVVDAGATCSNSGSASSPSCGCADGLSTLSAPSGSKACANGTFALTDGTASDGEFNWTCKGGLFNLITKNCSAAKIVPGCGTASGVPASSAPTTCAAACSAGTMTLTDAAGSDGFFNWTCNVGSTSVGCSAQNNTPACGAANGTTQTSSPYSPSDAAGCKTGFLRNLDSAGADGDFNWLCSVGGVDVQCSAIAKLAPKVRGTCGSANGSSVASVPSGTAACSTGSLSVTDAAASDGSFNWTCTVDTAVSCSAAKVTSTTGACGSANNTIVAAAPSGSAACAAGSASFSDSTGSDGSFNWGCSGFGGGSSATCTATKSKPPVCGNANGISAYRFWGIGYTPDGENYFGPVPKVPPIMSDSTNGFCTNYTLCVEWTNNVVKTDSSGSDGTFNWTCAAPGYAPVNCQATKTAAPKSCKSVGGWSATNPAVSSRVCVIDAYSKGLPIPTIADSEAATYYDTSKVPTPGFFVSDSTGTGSIDEFCSDGFLCTGSLGNCH